MYDLIEFRKNQHSQFGEDGILARIFQDIGTESRYCVEFGAWDGVHLSNSCALLESGWTGLLIEGNKSRFQELKKHWKQRSDVAVMNAMVGCHGPSALDVLLERAGAPQRFDLLSIDVDGDDYHIWEALRRFEARVVLIETNPTFPLNVEFVQKSGLYMGASALSLSKLGREKGYELVCYNTVNCIFVERDLAQLLPLKNRSFAYLYEIGREVFQSVSATFDGITFVYGDTPYGFRRRIRREKDIRDAAQHYRIVRDEEYRQLFAQ